MTTDTPAATRPPRAPGGWLRDAIVYEIYPQSFADSDGDGIGDLPGVLAHLDHLAWLGIDTVWFNPCFASPFLDAGYDVSDYLLVAPRYGTNDDLVRFVDAARERGIRVLLDLVVGHTATAHAWFRAALPDVPPAGAGDLAGDRYIWADPGPGAPALPAGFVPSPGPRPGSYLKNFYDSQPALNFGYARLDPAEGWRQPVDAPGPQANRAALREIMAFWLDRGIAGFRVDMAFSLVKDDPGFVATLDLWRELHAWLDTAYPEAVLIPEGIEWRDPRFWLDTVHGYAVPGADGDEAVAAATAAGPAFDADFSLVIERPHSSLFNNGGAGTLSWGSPGPCYFDADATGSTEDFLEFWAEHGRQWGPERLVLLASSDHDFDRLRCGTRGPEQLGVAFAFLLTWGTVPSIYAGDEIGMRYLPGLGDVEGSICHPTYNRAGARTPVQWDDTANAGFSTAPAERLYLPVDTGPSRPTVASQVDDPASTLNRVRRLVALRRSVPDLGPDGATTVLHEGYPLVYLRGDRHLVVLNPGREPVSVVLADAPAAAAVTEALLDAAAPDAELPPPGALGGARALEVDGVELAGGTVRAAGFGYGVFELAG